MKRIKLVKLLSGREMSHLLNIVTLTCNWKPTWWPIGCRVANQHLRLLRFWLEGSSGTATGWPIGCRVAKSPHYLRLLRFWLEGSSGTATGWPMGCRVAKPPHYLRLLRFWLEGSSGTATGWPIGCRVAKSPQQLRLLRFWLEGSSGTASCWPTGCMPHSKIRQAVLGWTVQTARHPSWPIGCGVLRSAAWGGDLPPRGRNIRWPLSPPPGWCPRNKNGVLTHDDVNVENIQNSVVDPDPDWIRIQWGPWIRIPIRIRTRIQEGKNDP